MQEFLCCGNVLFCLNDTYCFSGKPLVLDVLSLILALLRWGAVTARTWQTDI